MPTMHWRSYQSLIRAKIVIEHSQSMALLMATPAMIIIHRVTWTVASFCWTPSHFGLGAFVQLRSPNSVLTLPSLKGRVCDGIINYKDGIIKS